MEEATQALDRGKDVDVIYLDFAKSFEKVPHKRLLRKLSGYKAVVGGAVGPAMAGPLFLPEMVLARPHFWPNTILAVPFSHVSSRPSLMIYFSMIKD